MNAVTKWFNVLLPKLKPHLYSNGGPIIMIQLENDYGSYKACDRNYLASLNSLVKQHLGSDVILSTVDVGSKNALRCGSPFSANLATIFFGPYEGDPDDKFTDLLEFQPNAPWINSEYYTGWMDHWGYAHFHVSPQHFTEGLINLMAYSPRISVNIYMLHGGTNFGLWSGAVDRPFSAQITSYDYNAPLSEDGDTTHFYQLLRAAIFKRKNITAPALPRNSTKRAYETIQQRLVSHIIAYSTNGATSQAPLPMESLRQYEGFMVYRTQFYRNAGQPVRLKFKNVADYVYIYTASVNLDSLVFHGTVSRNDRSFVFHFTPTINTTDLIILVENAGYISYASRNFNDQKGIFGPISADGRELLGWTMMPICLTPYSPFQCNESLSEDISKKFLTLQSNTQQNNSIRWPVEGSVFVGSLDIRNPEDIADTFVLLTNFTRGILIVNDKILGRFNQALGPQLRLYLPKSFLKTGSNIFITIELDSLWLNETMVGGIVPKDMLYPIAFDREMHWHTKRKRPTY